MYITRITSVMAATATAGIVCAPIVSADAAATPEIITQPLGNQAKLVDGAVVQGWTISNLKPSTDAIPHHVNGTLWEATATDEAIQGGATPIVSNFNARAQDGQTYRALFGAATSQGVNPATLSQGQETTGKVYFDVTGANPDSVVYNAGGQDLLVWVQPPPSTSRTTTPSYSYPSGSYTAESPATAAPAATPPTPGAPAPQGTTGVPASVGTQAPVPAGSQGTPLPAGSQGTPLPEGTPAAPLLEGAPSAPLPAGTPAVPLPAGSQGTPVAPPAAGAPLPASTEMAPQGAQGTPLPEGGEQVPSPTTYTPAPTP